jgi:hypothetical protein
MKKVLLMSSLLRRRIRMIKILRILLLSVVTVTLTGINSMATPTWNDSTFNISEYSSVFSEDQNTNYLDPGYGGQPYDVEYLGLSVAGGKIYFGLQTGVNLDSPATTGNNQPGDLAFDIGNDGIWDYGLRIWEPRPSASLLDASGWMDVRYTQHAISNPWRVSSGTDSGVFGTDFDFRKGTGTDGFNNGTYWIEGYINLAALGLSSFDTAIASNFTMWCGNDNGKAVVAPVPEPASMLLLGTGLIGLPGWGRKKFKKKQ